MPFTPFHFGPGLLGKSAAPRHYSWLAFIASQVVIDCESLYNIVRHAYPVHRFLHTFAGATLAGIVTGLGLVSIRRVVRMPSWIANSRPALKSEVSDLGILVGAVVGGISHPFLDGLMHRDVHPFAPWSDANPFLRLVTSETVYLGCVALGVVGCVVLFLRLRR